ncbi:hypothetical protein [Mesorhizobium sp. CAU 1741]|uniref:hypothetical protein n=1 Tax=Mesorhizobium sp. CAU 1741 TaxID=3140366 RepID=UPI00325B30D7
MSLVSGEASDAIGRARRAAIVYLFAALLAVAGIAFLIIAGFVATAEEIGVLEAALAFGGGFIAVAVILLIAYRVASGIRRRRVARRRKTEAKAVAGAAAIALIPTLLASRGGGMMLVIPALAGLAYAVYREQTARRPHDPTLPD